MTEARYELALERRRKAGPAFGRALDAPLRPFREAAPA